MTFNHVTLQSRHTTPRPTFNRPRRKCQVDNIVRNTESQLGATSSHAESHSVQATGYVPNKYLIASLMSSSNKCYFGHRSPATSCLCRAAASHRSKYILFSKSYSVRNERRVVLLCTASNFDSSTRRATFPSACKLSLRNKYKTIPSRTGLTDQICTYNRMAMLAACLPRRLGVQDALVLKQARGPATQY
jgi:hypothetical protein